jgi:serine O-acetyltransferase
MINAIQLYRFSRFLYLNKIPFLPKVIQGILFLIYNCHISYKAKIGKNSFFMHKGMATLILDYVEIGVNCRIGMNIMITGKTPYKNVPKIGNNVWIGPGAIISGPVIIEDNVIIAPNSMLLKSVPKNKIVAGNPAKIIGDITELDYDIFNNSSYDEGIMPYLIDKTITNIK